MNKMNLIRLGSLAQKKYNMKASFEILEVASDAPHAVRIAVPSTLGTVAYGPAVPFETDDLVLEKVGIPTMREFMWIGYSARANTLVIQEPA